MNPKTYADGFRQQVIDLIQDTIGDKNATYYPMVFVQLVGNHAAAWLLSQILYWTDRTSDPEGWFYKSFDDWKQEGCLSRAQIERALYGDPRTRKARLTLAELGVETKVRRAPDGSPTTHYRIDRDVFLSKLAAFLQPDLQQNDSPICDNVADGTATFSQVELQQSGETRSTETSSETPESEISSESSPPTPPDDDDLKNFKTFERRFGRLKEVTRIELRAAIERLGAGRVGEVVERCAKRGRSWAYVLAALANEPTTETTVSENTKALLAQMLEGEYEVPEQAVPTARVADVFDPQSGWIVREVWQAVAHQLEMQLDRASFDTFLRASMLLDYDRDQSAFTVLVQTSYAREMCQHRLYRLIARVLRDVCRRPMEARFVTPSEWLGQGRVEAIA
jgi:hypothetical protein